MDAMTGHAELKTDKKKDVLDFVSANLDSLRDRRIDILLTDSAVYVVNVSSTREPTVP